MINLAAADLLFVLFCVPFTGVLYATSGTWPFGAAYCYAYNYLTYVSAYGSVWTLVMLAADRYVVIITKRCYRKSSNATP